MTPFSSRFTPRAPWRRRFPVPLAAIAQAAMLVGLVQSAATAPAHAQDAPAVPASAHYHVDAGSLSSALQAFARISGQAVLASDALVQGRQSPGVHGAFGAQEALNRLLAGTGVQASRNASGQWVLAVAPTDRGAATAAAGPALPEVTVTGTSLATDIQLYPGSVTVIPQDELDRTSNVIEALANVPGVTTGGDSGRSTGQQFNIRGFGYQSEDRVIVLHDGVRRSTALYSNQMSSFRADNDLLKRAEVVKGSSSVQHGGGAIGGVVSMQTKDAKDFLPEGKDFGGAAKLRYEHNNYREGYVAAAAAPQDKPYELLIYGKKGQTGDLTMSRQIGTIAGKPNDKIDNDEDLRVLFLKGTLKPTAEQRASLSVYDYRIDNRTTWQSLYHTNYSSVTGPVTGSLTQRDVVGQYRFTSATNPWLDITATAYHASAMYDRGYSYVDAQKKPVDLDYANKDKRSGLRLSNEAHFQTGSVSHRLVTGLDYEERKEDATYLLSGVYTDFGSMPNTYKDTGLYAHLESSLLNDRLKLQLSGRYDRFDRRVNANEGSFKGSHFSPRIGASFALTEGLNLLGNWSEAFRAPTPHETSSEGPLNPHYWYLPNPNLKPETVREAELGLSYTQRNLFSPSDTLRAKLMYFNGRIQDMIVLDETRVHELASNGSPYATYQNIDRAKRHGVELQVDYQHARGGVGVGYSTLKQVDAATGRNTPQAFANKLTLSGHFKPLAGLRIGANATHWFKPKQNPATTVSGGTTYWYIRKDFTVVDVYADWQPNPGGSGVFGRDLSLRVGVNNLFDASFMNARNVETSPLVGKGRNFYVQLQAKF